MVIISAVIATIPAPVVCLVTVGRYLLQVCFCCVAVRKIRIYWKLLTFYWISIILGSMKTPIVPKCYTPETLRELAHEIQDSNVRRTWLETEILACAAAWERAIKAERTRSRIRARVIEIYYRCMHYFVGRYRNIYDDKRHDKTPRATTLA